MKLRESGMPEQAYWETLLDVEGILDAFQIGPHSGPLAELGCGYGTFTIPVARRSSDPVFAFDIDNSMVELTRQRALAVGLTNIKTELRDVFADGFGLADASCGVCLLFNILHGENPIGLLREAARVVRSGGFVAIIHWRRDIPTPRGPSMAIRPGPEELRVWTREVKSLAMSGAPMILPPWHWGIKLEKEPRQSLQGCRHSI